jgi:hypothetical protein
LYCVIRCPSIVKVVVTGMFMLVLLSFEKLKVRGTRQVRNLML